MRKEQDGAARLSRGAEGVAGAVLFSANLKTVSGGKRGGPLNKIHRLPEIAAPLNTILELARPEAFFACIALREGVGKRVFGLAARWRRRRYARRCRGARGVGRGHRAGRRQIHRHALGACRSVWS